MPVEFEMEINVQTSTRVGYRDFIEKLRVRLGVRFSHNRPVLAVQQEPPTRFFDLVIRTNDHSVRFRLRMDNLYLIGYQMQNGRWLEFNNETGVHLIGEQGTEFLGFNGSYISLLRAAGLEWKEVRVGFYNLGYGINQLATSTTGKIRARYLIVVIMMICESARLIPLSDYMATNFDSSYGTSSDDYNDGNRNREGQIQDWIDLVRAWGALSAALLRADAYPDESFELSNSVEFPPNRIIRNVPEAAAILGILLGPRSMTFDDGQCFFGATTCGSSTSTTAQAATQNPSSQTHGLGHDEIVNKDISWDASEIGNVYDKPIFQDLVGKNGSVTVNYAVLRNAVAARIFVTLEQGGESTPNVYGQVYAHYDNWEDDPKTTCLLFNRSSDDYVDVRLGQAIPLLRSVVAVPLDGSLIVKASLYDHDTLSGDDEIAKGAVEFPAQMSGTSSEEIKGEDGNYVRVTVYWTCAI
ncbi:hypothetical protein OIU84_028091 [Salix udensis]|uniref:rRNA N-glycosylase n=1 Tax=Salix udensis TaxID=889485 RepID=A0AAD6KBU3_9ROSI|nr:hypothetical protein OIU84_028091 [Salix udensis]